MIANEQIAIEKYKQELIEQQGYICPIIQVAVSPIETEILHVNEDDYAVSMEGLSILRAKFGNTYINDKIVYSITKTDNKLTRDMG